MTQIISVITPDYVLMASDRLVTHGTGPRAGQVFRDDECKLVSLCHTNGIGYSGLADLTGLPTHKWIGRTLAMAGCRDAGAASDVLVANTPTVLPNIPYHLRRLTFVIAGWSMFAGRAGLHPHVCVVSNCLGGQLDQLDLPELAFRRRIRLLQQNESIFHFVVGAPLNADRVVPFERNLRRVADNRVGPRDALRLVIEEIFATHSREGTVGDKVLALCIPRANAELFASSGHANLSGLMANSGGATFSYFDRDYNEYTQYGPTIVCGQFAATDLLYTNEPAKPMQSVSWRILYAPPKKA